MHSTHVRNEHAYFLLLQMIMRQSPVTPEEAALASAAAAGGDAAAEPVYIVGAKRLLASPSPAHAIPLARRWGALCAATCPTDHAALRPRRAGDSHCLSAAWRGAELPGGRKGWFAPVLVTGCKARPFAANPPTLRPPSKRRASPACFPFPGTEPGRCGGPLSPQGPGVAPPPGVRVLHQGELLLVRRAGAEGLEGAGSSPGARCDVCAALLRACVCVEGDVRLARRSLRARLRADGDAVRRD